MNEICIRLNGVTRLFDSPDPTTGTVTAVDKLDLSVRRGEIVALLGPNGAGKTTTLDMVLGFIQPTAGGVEVFGSTPSDAIAQGRVAAVLQTGGLLRDLTVRETVELIASTHEEPRSVESVIEQAGITAIQSQRVQSCSGGEQQRLRFAIALLGDPELLVLDEPTAGMDVQARRDFWAAMHHEADRGRTVVFATHYLQEAEDFAERTVLMANGRVVADGPTSEVRRRAGGRRVRARFAPESMQAVAAELRAHPEVHGVSIDHGTVELETTTSDDIARLVLGSLGGMDLEIAAASLEHAFIELTANKDNDTTHEGQLQ